MKLNRKHAKEVFQEYTSHYDMQDEKIALKAEHTYRVAALCDQIAGSLSLSGQDRELAWLSGLLHDIGRFEQARIYGTFLDAQSIDHGHLSVQILFEDEMLSKFVTDISTEESEILRNTIWYHSVYRLPEELDDRQVMFCQILRDADKIDILKVNVDYPMEEIYNTTTEILMHATVSEEVMQSFAEHHAVPHKLKKSAVDFIIGHISLCYELVYPISMQIVNEQGYLDRLLHFQSENPVTREQFQKIREEFS